MRTPNRQITFPDDFVQRFTKLFPKEEGAYEIVHRRLADGNVSEVARFLLGKNTKLTARQVHNAVQQDGTLDPVFLGEVDRGCDIADLYDEVMMLLRVS